MHAVQAFTLLALAGTSLALPSWGNFLGRREADNEVVQVEIVTMYTTVTVGGSAPQTTTAKPAAQTTHVYTAKPTSSSTPAPSTGSGSGSYSGGYMGIVEQWREKMGLSGLTQSSQLEANALKTAVDGNGQMAHELNPGSMAQVLAPGSTDEFEKVFVGGWLCERPGMSGLNGICSSMSAGWSYDGQTGHADILSSTSYSKIGCACSGGIWACDLA